jgi:IS5 family transposase
MFGSAAARIRAAARMRAKNQTGEISVARSGECSVASDSSTKNADGDRAQEMHQAKKGNNWYFGMKAHIGVDAQSGLVPTMAGTAATVNDLNMAGAPLHGDDQAAFGDAGYQGVHKRPEAAGPSWYVAMRPGLRRRLNPFIVPDFVAERVEQMKASIRAKVEHPFRVLKRQFGFTKVRYRGVRKNTAQVITLFALSNLCMARRQLMGVLG